MMYTYSKLYNNDILLTLVQSSKNVSMPEKQNDFQNYKKTHMSAHTILSSKMKNR